MNRLNVSRASPTKNGPMTPEFLPSVFYRLVTQHPCHAAIWVSGSPAAFPDRNDQPGDRLHYRCAPTSDSGSVIGVTGPGWAVGARTPS